MSLDCFVQGSKLNVLMAVARNRAIDAFVSRLSPRLIVVDSADSVSHSENIHDVQFALSFLQKAKMLEENDRVVVVIQNSVMNEDREIFNAVTARTLESGKQE